MSERAPPDFTLAARVMAYAQRLRKQCIETSDYLRVLASTQEAFAGATRIRNYSDNLVRDLRHAQWMVLDDATVRDLVGWGRPATCQLVTRSLRLARAPFTETATWLEWNYQVFDKTRAVAGESDGGNDADRIGYLIRPVRHVTKAVPAGALDPAMWMASEYFVALDGEVHISPLMYLIGCENTVGVEHEDDDTIQQLVNTADYKTALLFGNQWRWGPNAASCPALQHLAVTPDELIAARWAIVITGNELKELEQRLLDLVTRHAGVLRFLLMALALLDDASIQYVPRKKGPGRIVGGRLQPQHDHKLVRVPISLKPRQIIRYLGKKLETGSPGMREHLVRGHWQRYGQGEHRVRKWKLDYRRGDPALGVVRHDYSLERPES